MQSRWSVTLILLILAVALPPLRASGQPSITWLEADAPPFFIHEGPFQGQGYEDVVTDILEENLPEYEHHRLSANMARHMHEFTQGKEVCNVGLYRTPEREEILYFSIPSFFTLPTVLVIHKDRLADFGGSKTVSLAEVLRSGEMVIGHVEKRSYGKQVDAVLQQFGNDRNLFVYEGDELSSTFYRMLDSDRLDALIGLPEEAVFQAEKLGIRDKIMTLNIAENQTGYDSWFSHVGCSKTAWGKTVIERVNRILLEQRPTERYRAAYERWLDESSIENYRKLYREIFLNGR